MANLKLSNDLANLVLRATCIAMLCLVISRSRAEPADNWVQDYVVQFLSGKQDTPFGAGVYLGDGLVITAAHVVGTTRGVRIDAVDLPARLVRRGSFPELDLSLISVNQSKIPDSLRERRMSLCQEQSPAGTPVILAAPQGITRTSIASPLVIPPEFRTKYPTLISDPTTDGKSGSGVFDVKGKCLLGILSLKLYNIITRQGYASYFVPASTIKSFIPADVQELPSVRAWPQAPH
jgi:hypothetical protein